MNQLWNLGFEFRIQTRWPLISAAVATALSSAACDRHAAPSTDASQRTVQITEDSAARPLHFTDVTEGSGIHFTMTCGASPAREILEVNGGGVGLIDFDNDGDLDIFFINGATIDDPEHGPGCKLFENLGGLTFRDATAKAGINIHRWGMGIAVADYDGDGFDDVFVACYGPDVLLHNNGNGTFTDATAKAFAGNDGTGTGDPVNKGSNDDVSRPSTEIPEWSTSAAFGDVDNDGDLDLYVCRYLEFDVHHLPPHARYKGVEVMAGPHGLTPQHDVLYENRGDGTFGDVTAAAGCRPLRAAFGLNVVIVDFDGDGRQDIAVANYSMPDFYFHNLGNKASTAKASRHEASRDQGIGDSMPIVFEEIGVMSGLAANSDGSNQASMGMAIGDVDGNGRPDKFTTVFSSDTNSLHLNMDGRLFEDRSQQYGLAMVSRPYLGWACAFVDFDLDGDEDLFVVNGHVYPQATRETMDSEFEQPPLLFERDGARFKKVAPATAGDWLGKKHRDRNAVFADLDGDGDIDVVIAELNGPVRVLRNDAIQGTQSADGDWLIVELRDERPESKNHRGLGSRIELIMRDGSVETRQTRWLFTGGGFQSSGAPDAHFGLGKKSAHVTLDVRVTWADGFVQNVNSVSAGQHLIIRRPVS